MKQVAPTSRIRRNTAYNLLGAAVPLAVSLVTVPVYLHVIGDVRYGVLVLVWALLGFFGASDFGLARAAANAVARSAANAERAGAVVATGLALTLAAGVLAGALVLSIGSLLVEVVLDIPSDLEGETYAALVWIALSVPLTNAFWLSVGSIEGRERFLLANVLTALFAVLGQGVPLLAAVAWEPTLASVGAGLVAAGGASAAIALFASIRVLDVRSRLRLDRHAGRGLLAFGSWVALTGVLVPVVASLDRLVIGAVRGPLAVTHYAVPANLVGRLTLVPAGLARALFPRFSSVGVRDGEAVARASVVGLVAVVTPLVVAALVVLEPFLRLWVGSEIADAGAPVGAVLLLGVWANSLAHVPYALLQGRGRPDVPAKLHLVEIPGYLLLLWLGLAWAGIEGAAWAWTCRAVADAALLFRFASARIVDAAVVGVGAGGVLASYAVTATLSNGHTRALVGALLVAVASAWALRIAWSHGLLERRPRERVETAAGG